MRAFAFVSVLAFACSSPPKKPTPRPPATSAELSPALAPLAWWLGDWKAREGDTGIEHWVAASGAMYGISLHDGGGFEVMIVDDGEGPGKPDGVLRFIAMPGGAKQVEFRQRDPHDASITASVTFANDQHDYPKSITYRRDKDELHAVLGGDGKSDNYRFSTTTSERAPALEQADIAFAKDTAARGIEGWVAAFDAKGAMMRKAGRVEGANAIREMMGPVLATTKVEWAPIASGMHGDVGFTVGKATFTGETELKSTYVTIWKKQADGGWKVLFDTGRVVQD